LDTVNNGFTPNDKYYFVKLMAASQSAKVKVGGQEIKAVTSMDELNKAQAACYYFDAQNKSVLVKVFDNASNAQIEVCQ
jgi:Ser/Thr protein kinase RdoA (MazF antagonist)